MHGSTFVKHLLSVSQSNRLAKLRKCILQSASCGIRYRPRLFDQVGHQTKYASMGNIGFPNGLVFRYGNFYIPRVEKSSKISPRAKNLVLPRAVGPRETRFFSQGLIFEDFSTHGMKKFPYLKPTTYSEIVFL